VLKAELGLIWAADFFNRTTIARSVQTNPETTLLGHESGMFGDFEARQRNKAVLFGDETFKFAGYVFLHPNR
jgi:hypothetical protein